VSTTAITNATDGRLTDSPFWTLGWSGAKRRVAFSLSAPFRSSTCARSFAVLGLVVSQYRNHLDRQQLIKIPERLIG
jgi:hypothetical protein